MIFLEKGLITSISLSPDNQWVVSSLRTTPDSIQIFDAQKGNWVCTLKGHAHTVWMVDFSPAGQYLVSGSGEGLVRLWRYETLAGDGKIG